MKECQQLWHQKPTSASFATTYESVLLTLAPVHVPIW